MKKFKVWDPERDDEPTGFNAEGYDARWVATDWAEKTDPDLDEFDSMEVHVIDEKGTLTRFTVDVEIERTYHAHEDKS